MTKIFKSGSYDFSSRGGWRFGHATTLTPSLFLMEILRLIAARGIAGVDCNDVDIYRASPCLRFSAIFGHEAPHIEHDLHLDFDGYSRKHIEPIAEAFVDKIQSGMAETPGVLRFHKLVIPPIPWINGVVETYKNIHARTLVSEDPLAMCIDMRYDLVQIVAPAA